MKQHALVFLRPPGLMNPTTDVTNCAWLRLQTPLMIAVERNSQELVRLLLQAGASPARGAEKGGALSSALHKGPSAAPVICSMLAGSGGPAAVGAVALAGAGSSHRMTTAYRRQSADLAHAAAPEHCSPGHLVYDRCAHLPASLPPNRLRAAGACQSRQDSAGQHDRPGVETAAGTDAGVFGRASHTTYVGPVYAHFGDALMLAGYARPGGKAKHRARASGYAR